MIYSRGMKTILASRIWRQWKIYILLIFYKSVPNWITKCWNLCELLVTNYIPIWLIKETQSYYYNRYVHNTHSSILGCKTEIKFLFVEIFQKCLIIRSLTPAQSQIPVIWYSCSENAWKKWGGRRRRKSYYVKRNMK